MTRMGALRLLERRPLLLLLIPRESSIPLGGLHTRPRLGVVKQMPHAVLDAARLGAAAAAAAGGASATRPRARRDASSILGRGGFDAAFLLLEQALLELAPDLGGQVFGLVEGDGDVVVDGVDVGRVVVDAAGGFGARDRGEFAAQARVVVVVVEWGLRGARGPAGAAGELRDDGGGVAFEAAEGVAEFAGEVVFGFGERDGG